MLYFCKSGALFQLFFITQTPDLAMSKTAGSFVNSTEKEPNQKNRATASAIPVTPPIYIYNKTYQQAAHDWRPAAFLNLKVHY